MLSSFFSLFKFLPMLTFLVWGVSTAQQVSIKGKVTDTKNSPIMGATVSLKGTSKGTMTDEKGRFSIQGNWYGEKTLVVSFVGYQDYEENIPLTNGTNVVKNITLNEGYDLSEVMITGKSKIQQIEALAYNVDVIDAKKLKNTTLDVGHALDKVAGIRVRESGGIGSRMNLSMNGFRGNQVKVFIDGIPMENFGNAFQLNNIPINIAERIEVYKGVVPVGLGSDALGGAINVVTDSYEKTHLDVSYAYGSFNTHRTNIDMTYVTKNDFIVNVNAFQNYSDNDYKVNVDVADINTGEYTRNQEVKRFHDQYNNETIIGNVGVVNKTYADRLLVGVTLGQVYDEIQTAQRLVRVFGKRHSRSTIVMPTLKYKKDDLIIKGLDVNVNANYNLGYEKVIDTLNRSYDWYGNYKEDDTPGGEQSYTHSKFRNNNGLVNASFNYKINSRHHVSLSNVFTSFDRKQENLLSPEEDNYNKPRQSFKNVLGLSYRYEKNDWSATLFTKNYNQVNKFIQSYTPADSNEVVDVQQKNQMNNFGGGIAATYFFNENLQIKGSYEYSYRLPTGNELFGDGNITLEGNTSLNPESSNNYNLGTSYFFALRNKHQFTIDGTLFYRDSKDFIRPRLNNNQVLQTMDNLQDVTNIGGELQVNYTYKNLLTGFNLTYQDLRNNTKDIEGSESLVYRDRIPNMPYFYGNANITYNFEDLWNKGHHLSLGYNLLYVHAFYRYWPSLGTQTSKYGIPEQVSHDLMATYTLKKFSFTIEARNLLNENLYDNFSLQKPGRNFTGKIRYSF